MKIYKMRKNGDPKEEFKYDTSLVNQETKRYTMTRDDNPDDNYDFEAEDE